MNSIYSLHRFPSHFLLLYEHRIGFRERSKRAESWSPAGHHLGGGDGRVVLTRKTVELQASYQG
ncbi:hypothetical protein Hanom_Chr16g01421451 [Helianthus anomalus]